MKRILLILLTVSFLALLYPHEINSESGIHYTETTVDKVYGSKNFTLPLSNPDHIKVKYTSSNKNVAKVDSKSGKVTLKGVGITKISAQGSGYTASYKIKVVPKSTKITSLKCFGDEVSVKWKKQSVKTSGYQIQYSRNEDFSDCKTKTVSSKKTTSKVITVANPGETYYFRIRTYKKVGNKKYCSAWSEVKSKKTGFDDVAKDMTKIAQEYSSDTDYLILADCTKNLTAVFKGEKGKWNAVKVWSCATGAPYSPTRKGVYTLQGRGKSFYAYGSLCYYYTIYSGPYYFHSICYNADGSLQDGRLGMNISHGCVRLATENAKWIYDHVPDGTKVFVY